LIRRREQGATLSRPSHGGHGIFAALQRLRQAGLPLVADEEAGAELYVKLRRRWDPLIAALAPAMAYSMDEIDPARSRPQEAERVVPQGVV